MKNIILIALSVISLTSCKNNSQLIFEDPYKDHYKLFGLSKDVASASYEKIVHEVTDGGYFPTSKNVNEMLVLMYYPSSSNKLKYMANIQNANIFNYPITSNQYLINELLLNENITSRNVNIKLDNGKIVAYSNEDDDRSFSLSCKYNGEGMIEVIDIKSPGKNRLLTFKNKGDFLEQVIEQSVDKIDTINFNHLIVNENQIKIERLATYEWDKRKIIEVNLLNQNGVKKLKKLFYKDDNQTFNFIDNRLSENFRETDNSDFNGYTKINYEKNQVKSVLEADKTKKNKVNYLLDQGLNIAEIRVETDQIKERNIGLTFEYKLNEKNDWTEMIYYNDRRYYDDAKKKAKYIRTRLESYGYGGLDIMKNTESREAEFDVIYMADFCSKVFIRRNLTYSE